MKTFSSDSKCHRDAPPFADTAAIASDLFESGTPALKSELVETVVSLRKSVFLAGIFGALQCLDLPNRLPHSQ